MTFLRNKFQGVYLLNVCVVKVDKYFYLVYCLYLSNMNSPRSQNDKKETPMKSPSDPPISAMKEMVG